MLVNEHKKNKIHIVKFNTKLRMNKGVLSMMMGIFFPFSNYSIQIKLNEKNI